MRCGEESLNFSTSWTGGWRNSAELESSGKVLCCVQSRKGRVVNMELKEFARARLAEELEKDAISWAGTKTVLKSVKGKAKDLVSALKGKAKAVAPALKGTATAKGVREGASDIKHLRNAGYNWRQILGLTGAKSEVSAGSAAAIRQIRNKALKSGAATAGLYGGGLAAGGGALALARRKKKD